MLFCIGMQPILHDGRDHTMKLKAERVMIVNSPGGLYTCAVFSFWFNHVIYFNQFSRPLGIAVAMASLDEEKMKPWVAG